MNLLYVTYYPKSDATKPFQCQLLSSATRIACKLQCSYSYELVYIIAHWFYKFEN
ncbi:hypothetical protein [Wolbachia endosymbiont (group A) of Gastracanthus pulcherrimus]|uniref:hypothetical protein n=1 Tax=unclassified Wolbachia TaxID=2640676 RepID=UPI00334271E3